MIGQKALVQRRARQLVTPETSDSENGSPESNVDDQQVARAGEHAL